MYIRAAIVVPFGEQCVIDGVAKECDLSLICDFENNQCTCAQEFTWDDQYELCIHDEGKQYIFKRYTNISN